MRCEGITEETDRAIFLSGARGRFSSASSARNCGISEPVTQRVFTRGGDPAFPKERSREGGGGGTKKRDEEEEGGTGDKREEEKEEEEEGRIQTSLGRA